MTPPQGLRLRFQAIRAAAESQPYEGIPGLFLRLDRLRHLGASPYHLSNWRYGRDLGAKEAPPRHFSNHPSLDQHSDWAEKEWYLRMSVSQSIKWSEFLFFGGFAKFVGLLSSQLV